MADQTLAIHLRGALNAIATIAAAAAIEDKYDDVGKEDALSALDELDAAAAKMRRRLNRRSKEPK